MSAQNGNNRLFYFIPSITIVILWSVYMLFSERLFLMLQHWELSLTMVAGSLVAGATSEGGGAVAFPVFTKVLHIPPHIARTFSLAIQMVGMGTAAIVIFKYKIKIIKEAIIYSSIGGVLGIYIGTIYVSPMLSPAWFKIAFTILTLAFGFVLYLENRNKDIKRFNSIQSKEKFNIILLLFVGSIGGVFTSIVGTGIDFLTFSVLVIYFNISEKVATPTSVVLMAINSTIGFIIHNNFLGTFKGAVFDYWLVCIPIVVFGAPIGAIISSKTSRENIIRFLLILIAIEFISTILIVKFDTNSKIFGPIFFFFLISLFWLLKKMRDKKQTIQE